MTLLEGMAAGKAVVCEKPVTLSSADLEEMIACAEKCGKLFTVHQNRRWDIDYDIARNILSAFCLVLIIVKLVLLIVL